MQVEQDRVGPVLGYEPERLLAVRGRADHVDAREPAEEQDQALAHAGLIVRDNDAQRRLHSAHAVILAVFSSGVESGTWAVTTQQLPSLPASSVPFSIRSRSRIPVRP